MARGFQAGELSNILKLKNSLAQQNTPAIPALWERGRRMSKSSKTAWFPHSEFQEAGHSRLCVATNKHPGSGADTW